MSDKMGSPVYALLPGYTPLPGYIHYVTPDKRRTSAGQAAGTCWGTPLTGKKEQLQLQEKREEN